MVGLEGKARHSTRQAAHKWQSQGETSVEEQREQRLTTSHCSSSTYNLSINQSVNDSIKRHPPESGM